MILMTRIVMAILVVFAAAALSFNDESHWRRLFDDRETDEFLDFSDATKRYDRGLTKIQEIHSIWRSMGVAKSSTTIK